MRESLFARWRSSFFTGLAVILPGIITFAIVKWSFGTIASLTDTLLFFIPPQITHETNGIGPIHWYWSLLALAVAVAMVSVVGVLTRYYIGKRIIAWLDYTMLRVPLLNKVYGTIKQVNKAFTSGNKTAFKTVVLVEYPREGIYSIGFVTTENHDEIQIATKKDTVCIFIPTTPIPTAGFLIFVPREKVTKLNLSVAEGIKYIISLGAISQELSSTEAQKIKSSNRD